MEQDNLIYYIEKYLDDGLDDKNPDWGENLACSLIGTMIGKDRYILDKLGPIRSNICSIIIGASRLGYKTIPLKKTRELSKLLAVQINNEIVVNNEFTIEKFEESKKLIKKKGRKTSELTDLKNEIDDIEAQFVKYDLPESFSSEGLLKFLIKDENKIGSIHSDEFTTLVKGVKSKEYMSSLFEDISRMFDNEFQSHATISRGPEDAGVIHVTIVSATTPYLFTIMDDGFFQQGTGNRILWIMSDDPQEIDKDKDKENFVDFYYNVDDADKIKQRKQDIINKLILIREFPMGIVQVSFEGGSLLYDYMNECYNKATRIYKEKGMNNTDSSLIAGLALNAHKLALLHCFGRVAMLDKSEIVDNLEITAVDAEWAINKTNRHFEHYIKMMDIATEIRQIGGYNNLSREFDRILYLLDKFNGVITKEQITKYNKWNLHHKDSVINAMIEAKLISVNVVNGVTTYTKYKPHIYPISTGEPVSLNKIFKLDTDTPNTPKA